MGTDAKGTKNSRLSLPNAMRMLVNAAVLIGTSLNTTVPTIGWLATIKLLTAPLSARDPNEASAAKYSAASAVYATERIASARVLRYENPPMVSWRSPWRLVMVIRQVTKRLAASQVFNSNR